MTLAALETELSRARLTLESKALHITQWGNSPEEALQRLLSWQNEPPPNALMWLTALQECEPLPELSAEESTVVALYLDAACEAIQVMIPWEPLRDIHLPAARAVFLFRLFEQGWRHSGPDKIAQLLGSLAERPWPLPDTHDKN